MNSSAMICAGDAKKRTWTGAIFSVVSSKLLKHFVIFSSKVETRSSRDPLKFSLKLSIIVEADEEVAFAGRLSTPEDEEGEEEEAVGVVSGEASSTSLSLRQLAESFEDEAAAFLIETSFERLGVMTLELAEVAP